jgi:hypothetical protein
MIPVIGHMEGEVTVYIILVNEEETVQDFVDKLCHMVIERRLPQVSTEYEVYLKNQKLPLDSKIRDTEIAVMDIINVRPLIPTGVF